jgi:hypothetical protein
MAFQNSLFWLVDKRSVKTHIRTVVRIFRIWTGVPDVKCSQTQFSHIINRLLTSLVRSVLWNIRPLLFAWTSLLHRSVHTKKPRSDISQYRPHARSISRYYQDRGLDNSRYHTKTEFNKCSILFSKAEKKAKPFCLHFV